MSKSKGWTAKIFRGITFCPEILNQFRALHLEINPPENRNRPSTLTLCQSQIKMLIIFRLSRNLIIRPHLLSVPTPAGLVTAALSSTTAAQSAARSAAPGERRPQSSSDRIWTRSLRMPRPNRAMFLISLFFFPPLMPGRKRLQVSRGENQPMSINCQEPTAPPACFLSWRVLSRKLWKGSQRSKQNLQKPRTASTTTTFHLLKMQILTSVNLSHHQFVRKLNQIIKREIWCGKDKFLRRKIWIC